MHQAGTPTVIAVIYMLVAVTVLIVRVIGTLIRRQERPRFLRRWYHLVLSLLWDTVVSAAWLLAMVIWLVSFIRDSRMQAHAQ